MRYHLQWQGGLFCLVFFLPATCSPLPPSNSSSSRHLCLQDQRNALLHFKKSFTIENVIYSDYHYDYATDSITKLDCHSKTESWKIGVDCCLWEGVTCDAVTGRVIGLNLACSMLHGNLLPTSSLFQLQHLQQVDLSNNNFNGSSVPSQLGQLSKLTRLNLNSSNFVGQVPSEIAFLSRLVSLDLSFNTDLKMEQTTFSRLVQNLTRLRELSLNLADMSSVVPSFLMNLTSLLSLKAWNCGLRGEFPAVFDRPNFQLLDVANNTGLTGSLSLSNVSRDLHYLSLSSTGISIYLEPSSASHLMSLETLSLENCNIVKPNLAVVGNFTTLIHLDLSFNNLVEQTIPSTFGNLKELTNLYLANDSFGGPIPDFLGNLTKLTSLDLSQNDFTGPILPSLLALPSLSTLFLQGNLLTGSISPFMYTSLTYLDLSGNRLQGPLPSALFNLVNLSVLMLQSNEKLTDAVPSSICNLKSLEILDLSHNSFRGSIPQCLGSFTNSLQVFHLGMNNFQGTIPDMFSRGNGLRYLNLNGNELEGQVPESIINCRRLEFLDLGNNKIEDKFPHFLGTLPTLELLSLQSNKIHGCLSSLTTNYSFPKLRILDLSNNIMGGPLPTEFFSNFKAMISFDKKMSYMREENYPYDYSVELTYKGLNIELVKIQTILITINLSGNRFKGEIPGSIAELKGLQHLNLSHNFLTGHIPPSLASLVNLESLDLSSNVLVGRIPMQLVNLTFLHVFNLSYNKLEGPVPQGYQFDTFDGGSYEGNPGLCGIPLPKQCKSGKTPEPAAASSNSEEDDDDGFFSGFRWTAAWMGYGCGLVLGLSIGYIALTTTRLGWFVRRIEGRWHGKGRRYRKNRH